MGFRRNQNKYDEFREYSESDFKLLRTYRIRSIITNNFPSKKQIMLLAPMTCKSECTLPSRMCIFPIPSAAVKRCMSTGLRFVHSNILSGPAPSCKDIIFFTEGWRRMQEYEHQLKSQFLDLLQEFKPFKLKTFPEATIIT